MASKYMKIYNEIVSEIQNGNIEPRSMLKSESELMQEYSVSRDTVRKALNLLERDGYIQRLQGKGSIVLDINKFDFPVSGLTSFKELSERMGGRTRTYVKELALVKPNDFLMKHLNVSKDDEVWKVVRVREIGGKKIILDKDYFNRKFVPALTREICEDSIYEYIENKLGLKIGYAKKVITVQKASEEDIKYLDFDKFDMIVVVKNYVYLEDTTLFQYTESRHRPDKFRFVDFARRSR
ncbi:trehalose operon repressor [Fonticella tunisiensis]|uniref:Trehalose operon repressor n=1 Tax=Fonticella tunisiensis TaxID=1096341 RepID=A0A4R7KAK8_9CLOT|nr:trehalose operon repressor [Fonticella tunisiensis]TDT51051.1 GntR family transcriptional regulator [Fonticella tunisiensis]